MPKFFKIFILALLTSGCTTTVAPTYTSSGASGYRINCGGFFGDGDLASCYQKAGDTCESRGYRVLQTSLGSVLIECRPTNEQIRLPQD